MLAISAIGLPLYWLREPYRQQGAGFDRGTAYFEHKEIQRGEELFQASPGNPPTPREPHFGCETCHGPEGVGGVAVYTLTDPLNPDAVARQVTWAAPPLNTVMLRYRPEEVKNIIIYGRQGTPMPPWGIEGGGPMNDQQIDDLVAYLQEIALDPAEVKEKNLAQFGTDGQKIFDGFCARCHTMGFSYGEPGPIGGGALGPSLAGGAVTRQFPAVADQVEWVAKTAEYGELYGVRGLSEGVMPHFENELIARADPSRRGLREDPVSFALTRSLRSLRSGELLVLQPPAEPAASAVPLLEAGSAGLGRQPSGPPSAVGVAGGDTPLRHTGAADGRDVLLGALSWEPQIKGGLYVLLAVLILPGSGYLLLATNTGARLGFMLAFAGFTGFMVIIGSVWWIYGIGPRDRRRSGSPRSSPSATWATPTPRALAGFPEGWVDVDPTDPAVADAQPVVDGALTGGEDGGGLFKASSEYLVTAAYEKGGETSGPLGLDFRPFDVFHRPTTWRWRSGPSSTRRRSKVSPRPNRHRIRARTR